MTSDVRRTVLVPRFSSFVGAQAFTTQPVPVEIFEAANLTAWRGTALGTAATFSDVVQQSQDLQIWSDLATLSPSANAESSAGVSFTMNWMRLSITLGGTNPVVSCWVVGDFMTRRGVS